MLLSEVAVGDSCGVVVPVGIEIYGSGVAKGEAVVFGSDWSGKSLSTMGLDGTGDEMLFGGERVLETSGMLG